MKSLWTLSRFEGIESSWHQAWSDNGFNSKLWGGDADWSQKTDELWGDSSWSRCFNLDTFCSETMG